MSELEGYVNINFHSFSSEPIDRRHFLSYILPCKRRRSVNHFKITALKTVSSVPHVWGVVAPDVRFWYYMASKRITWSKMDFKDFIDHYKDMSPEEIVADVRQSIADFENRNENGDSFGSHQVRKADATSKEAHARASRENGKLGGRPRKNVNPMPQESPKQQKRPTRPPRQPQKAYMLPKTPLPRNPDEVRDIVYKCNLDGDDAYQWWQMTMVDRHGRDRYGNPIYNWPGALIKFCEAKAAHRLSS